MGTRTTTQVGDWRDMRALASMSNASAEIGQAWMGLMGLTSGELPAMGLGAGERPAADVEVLAGGLAALEFELARRMHAADSSGSLPLPGPGGMLTARAWSVPWARRLARAGRFACDHPTIAGPWAAGVISSEHVDAVARNCESLAADELSAVLDELRAFWGVWSPAAVARFVRAAARMLHPPPGDEPTPDESDAHESRGLSFSVLGDTVLLSGELPRLEGELVVAAIDAFAERLRTEADHVPAAARRADALVELVNAAHARDALPTRGGLPVSLTVSVDTTACGDRIWSTSRGHELTPGERRFASCDVALTPILVDDVLCPDRPAALAPDGASSPGAVAVAPRDPAGAHRNSEGPHPHPASQRVAALAALLAGPLLPLAVGRTARTATPAQRRALAARDRGCIIPGCQVPAESCQSHHVTEWAEGGATDIDNLALLCWSHHRQVDLNLWMISPGRPAEAAHAGSPTERAWPGNNGSPWTVRRTPRQRWRL